MNRKSTAKTKMAKVMKEKSFTKSKDINELQIEQRHFLDEIMQAMGEAVHLKLAGVFQTCKGHALGKAKKVGVNKTVVASKLKEKGYVLILALYLQLV